MCGGDIKVCFIGDVRVMRGVMCSDSVYVMVIGMRMALSSSGIYQQVSRIYMIAMIQ